MDPKWPLWAAIRPSGRTVGHALASRLVSASPSSPQSPAADVSAVDLPPAFAETVISVRDLRKDYGHRVTAVDGVSFDVRRGEIFGLLGSNGAGKTTTVECVQGLRTPTAGTVRVLGHDPRTEAAALRGRIGCQLQESRLPDHMKVWEALDLFASFTPGATDRDVLLDQWGLAEKRGASYSSLSGGQRQRLFIALALLSRPEVVFLDEMTPASTPRRGASPGVSSRR